MSARAQVLTVGTGNEGRMDGEMRRRYPGFEQSTAAAVGDQAERDETRLDVAVRRQRQIQ